MVSPDNRFEANKRLLHENARRQIRPITQALIEELFGDAEQYLHVSVNNFHDVWTDNIRKLINFDEFVKARKCIDKSIEKGIVFAQKNYIESIQYASYCSGLLYRINSRETPEKQIATCIAMMKSYPEEARAIEIVNILPIDTAMTRTRFKRILNGVLDKYKAATHAMLWEQLFQYVEKKNVLKSARFLYDADIEVSPEITRDAVMFCLDDHSVQKSDRNFILMVNIIINSIINGGDYTHFANYSHIIIERLKSINADALIAKLNAIKFANEITS